MLVGAPQDISRYQLEQVDGLQVYVQKGIKPAAEAINIDLMGFGPFKQLVVDGISFN
ncbi:MAG: hypothetical protein IMW96_03750 [Thermoanaerobacteraceae bacterium]|nr:hypothetical protein [Thermoanaerobacteraceae bacterium]